MLLGYRYQWGHVLPSQGGRHDFRSFHSPGSGSINRYCHLWGSHTDDQETLRSFTVRSGYFRGSASYLLHGGTLYELAKRASGLLEQLRLGWGHDL